MSVSHRPVLLISQVALHFAEKIRREIRKSTVDEASRPSILSWRSVWIIISFMSFFFFLFLHHRLLETKLNGQETGAYRLATLCAEDYKPYPAIGVS